MDEVTGKAEAESAGTGTALHRTRQATRLLALGLILGLAVELAYSRHWGSPVRWIPWVSLALTAVALWLVSPVRTQRGLTIARRIIGVVLASSLFGVWEHIEANHDSGPLDFKYATTWHTFSGSKQWWMAISGGVGPSPPLVPLALVIAAALVWICAIGQSPRGSENTAE